MHTTYFNWINTVYAVNALLADKDQKGQPATWEEVEKMHTYLHDLSDDTLIKMELLCEFDQKKQEPKMQKTGESGKEK